jgi:hypothetical protein
MSTASSQIHYVILSSFRYVCVASSYRLLLTAKGYRAAMLSCAAIEGHW